MRIRLRYILCCALLSMCFSCMEKESRPSLVPTNGGAMIINESPMALKGELLIKIRSEENAQTKVAGNLQKLCRSFPKMVSSNLNACFLNADVLKNELEQKDFTNGI